MSKPSASKPSASKPSASHADPAPETGISEPTLTAEAGRIAVRKT